MKQPIENNPDLWRSYFPQPTSDSHKYSRGTALIRGGAIMTGATRLASRASQRMGAGLVTLAVPTSALPIYAESLESVIVRPCDDPIAWKNFVDDQRHFSLLIGPGLGMGAAQKEEILTALAVHRPTVVDADGMTNFNGEPKELLDQLNGDCVLTPHEGEFEHMFGEDDKTDRKTQAQRAAQIAKCVVVLKGAETIIAAPDGRAIVNHNAPPWLATAGSGDVLGGMILGLIAQKMDVFHAAAAAVWIHGRIGAIHGAGLIAEDIVAGIPRVLHEILPQ